MAQTTKATRQNRTSTVDFQDPSTYFQLISDGKAFVEFVLACILSLGFQLTHTATCTSGDSLTRHSHYARVRLGGLTIWRIQCTSGKAVFTVLPHFVLRYRRMSPAVARQALIATPGGLSLECAPPSALSPPWPSIACSVPWDNTAWSRYWSSVACRCRHPCWPRRNTVAVSPIGSICPPLSVAV